MATSPLSVSTTFVKGLSAHSGGAAAASFALGGLSVASFVSLFLVRPLESLERNTIFSSWLSAAVATFWTRLLYFQNAATIDKDLQAAAKDLIDQLSALADKHAAALSKYPAPAAEPAPAATPATPGAPSSPAPVQPSPPGAQAPPPTSGAPGPPAG